MTPRRVSVKDSSSKNFAAYKGDLPIEARLANSNIYSAQGEPRQRGGSHPESSPTQSRERCGNCRGRENLRALANWRNRQTTPKIGRTNCRIPIQDRRRCCRINSSRLNADPSIRPEPLRYVGSWNRHELPLELLIEALKYVGDGSAIRPLQKLVDDPAEELRQAAQRALGEIKMRVSLSRFKPSVTSDGTD